MKIEEDQIELIEDYIKCENVFDEEISKNVRNNIKKNLTKAEKLLLITPSIINMIKALIPTTKLEAVISQEDFEKIASGILEMHIGKDGNIIPTLRDPITKKIVKLINLQVTNTNPELLMTLSTLSTQILVLKSIRTMEDIQDNLFDMSRIYENDKISIVSSCKERYLQAEKTENLQLKKDMLLSIITDTENIRNKLMQSQKENINKIQNQPKKTIEKVLSFHTLSLKKIDLLMKNIKKEMKAINLASMIEFMSYHKLLEDKAAKQSLSYYLQYIEDMFYLNNGLLNRLDELEETPFWKTSIEKIKQSLEVLIENEEYLLLEG